MEKLIQLVIAIFAVLTLNSCAHKKSHPPSDIKQEVVKDLLLPKYKKLLKDYPAPGSALTTCKAPKVKLNKKTNIYRKAISVAFEEAQQKPNFCGNYFLMATAGGGQTFFFDCKTGKPTVRKSEALDATPLMSVHSCIYVVNPPDDDDATEDFAANSSGKAPVPANGVPRIYHFVGKKVVKIPDPIWPKF